MGKYVVKNYPSPRLMETIGATNQSVPEEIGELVANSFDARRGEEKINVTIDLRNNEIKVIDNGKGMTLDVLEKAVCIAEDMSKHMERGKCAKGHFGMGFKTSCSTLGKFYEIYTRSDTINNEYHVEFNIEDYSSRPTNADAWDVEIEESARFRKSPLESASHGTAFVIKKVKDKNISLGAVYSYLGEAFKGHLETGDTIKLIKENGEEIQAIPKVYKFIEDSKIEIDEEFSVEENNSLMTCHITGWMALDSRTHNDVNYGFNIYRNNQLLEKWNKDWFKAHLMTSRIIGEVNMDFLEATFYKQGKQQSNKWALASQHMEDYLKGMVKASRDISKKGNAHDPSQVHRIISNLKEDYGLEADEDNAKDAKNLKNESNEPNKKKQSINDTIKGFAKEKSLILEEHGEIEITYLEKDGNYGYAFDYIFNDDEYDDGQNKELQIIVMKDHPLWQYKIDMELQKILVTSDAIYRMLVEKLNFESNDALKIRNEWINTRLGKQEASS